MLTFPPAPPGELNPRVGIREVAERAGVGISSVSRVISGHPDVSARMRQRVQGAIVALGYQPDFLAKSLRTGSTMTIGIVVSDVRNALMARIVHAAEARLRRDGYIALVVSSLDDTVLEAEYLAVLAQRRVDGVMVAVRDEGSEEIARRLATFPAPMLLLDRDLPGLPDARSVRFDHAAGLGEGLRHLVGLGHRRIALINGFPHVRPSRDRAAALFRARATYSGLETEIVAGLFTAEHGYSATVDLLARPARPTALVAGGNQILIGVMQALRELGAAVPYDVSLIACDDVPMARFLSPRLATVRRDVDSMGEIAAGLMLDAIAGQPPRAVTLTTTFDPAESCGHAREPALASRQPSPTSKHVKRS